VIIFYHIFGLGQRFVLEAGSFSLLPLTKLFISDLVKMIKARQYKKFFVKKYEQSY